LQGKLTIAGFLKVSGASAGIEADFGENLRKLHEQFDERRDVIFLLHITGDSTAVRHIGDFAERYGLADEEQVFFVTGGRPDLETLARQGYRLPFKEGESPAQNPYLVFAETSLTIRRYYDVRRIEEVRRLVEQIAILLPREKEPEPELRREREK
jgi:hypothetical protein